jgi:ATP-binding cassette subfamily B protein
MPDHGADPVALEVEARARPKQLSDLVQVVRRALRLVRTSARHLLWVTLGVQLALAALAAAQVWAVQWALGALIELDHKSTNAAAVIVPVLCVVAPMLATTLLTAVSGQLQRILGERVEQSTWNRVLDVSTQVDLETYESPSFYDQLRRTETNTLLRPFRVTMSLIELVGGLAAIVALTLALARMEPLLPPLLLVSAVPLLFLARRLGGLEFDFAVRVTPLLRERRYLREMLIGRSEAKELRSLQAVQPLVARYRELCSRYLDELSIQARRATIVGLIGGGATSLFTLAGLTVVVMLLARGDMTLAGAGATVVAIRLLGDRLRSAATSIGTLFESSLFLEDLESFEARTKCRSAVATDDARLSPPALSNLSLEHISFSYPEGGRVIEDVNLEIRVGEVVALVGENGSGKTTLSKIIGQLYAPTVGHVRWNGLDAAAFDVDGRRRQVSVTFQDFVRFSLTAAQNIGLGGGTTAPEQAQVVDAAIRSGADPFLRRLPLGYQTLLGKEFAGGADLSVGQWQRVALARAFYRDARLIVLDEPTAALDARAEHGFFEAVRALFADRAVLLITHRLASVRTADDIYVLHEGRVVEHGNHEALMQRGGRYAELFAMQASAFVAGE